MIYFVQLDWLRSHEVGTLTISFFFFCKQIFFAIRGAILFLRSRVYSFYRNILLLLTGDLDEHKTNIERSSNKKSFL